MSFAVKGWPSRNVSIRKDVCFYESVAFMAVEFTIFGNGIEAGKAINIPNVFGVWASKHKTNIACIAIKWYRQTGRRARKLVKAMKTGDWNEN